MGIKQRIQPNKAIPRVINKLSPKTFPPSRRILILFYPTYEVRREVMFSQVSVCPQGASTIGGFTGARGTLAKNFIFMQVSGKIGQIIGWYPLSGLALPPGSATKYPQSCHWSCPRSCRGYPCEDRGYPVPWPGQGYPPPSQDREYPPARTGGTPLPPTKTGGTPSPRPGRGDSVGPNSWHFRVLRRKSANSGKYPKSNFKEF